MLGPWVPGECSKSCTGADGIHGTQTMFRKIVAEKNEFGAKCPPMKLERACKVGVKCPIDCIVGEWTPFSKCTKDCGGGSKTRDRPILTPDDHGGTPCPETAETTACNTHSCDVDCVLHDWTAWSPCTKSCRAYRWSGAGMHSRKRKIRVAIKGNGKCPRPSQRQRYEVAKCNNFICPRQLNCIASMDLIVTIDGSGSLFYRTWRRKLWGKNFERSRKFTQTFVDSSTMDGWDAQDQDSAVDESKPELGKKMPKHMRMGVNLFSTRTKVISPLTGDKKKLTA